MINHEVTLYCFTNHEFPEEEGRIKIKTISINPEDYMPFFPMATLKRYFCFDLHKEILSKMDYLFYCDADMRFVSAVGDEILPELSSNGLVGTVHPGFFNKNRQEFTYENRKESTAYIDPKDGKIYFAGGFNGGTSEAFLKMSEQLKNNIEIDLSNEIISRWHDESHTNKYFIEHQPKILSPSYCYPESWSLPFEKKILALDKNHAEIRN